MTKMKKAKSSRSKTTGGSRATKKGVKASAAPKATKVFGGVRFTKKACGKTKTAAKATADSLRKKGKKARVVKTTVGYCVYTRG